MTRINRPHERAEVQHETSTRHDIRLVMPAGIWEKVGDSDEVYLHLTGEKSDAVMKIPYATLQRLRKGDPRVWDHNTGRLKRDEPDDLTTQNY